MDKYLVGVSQLSLTFNKNCIEEFDVKPRNIRE